MNVASQLRVNPRGPLFLLAAMQTLQPTQEADESRRVVVAEMQQLVKQVRSNPQQLPLGT